jgi:FixJ family two-component response regulator
MDANWALKSVRDSATKLVAKLTERERQVFQGMARGLSNKLIAHHLGISTRTVEMHRAKMMNRLECESVAEVVGIALHSGEDLTPWHHSAEKTNR